MDNLFKVANEEFYLDLDKISQLIRIEPSIEEILIYQQQSEETTTEEKEETKDEVVHNNGDLIPNQSMMDVAKWEVIRALLESVLNENGIIDESMGIQKLEKQLSIPFRLSFNTLLKNKIIKRNG
jgi:hypothetical protein